MSLKKHMFWKHKIEFNFLLTLLKWIIYINIIIEIFKDIKNIKKFKAKGKNDFHAKYINLSYRNRGKVPRAQINTKDKNINLK